MLGNVKAIKDADRMTGNGMEKVHSRGVEDAGPRRHVLSWLQWEADGGVKMDSDVGCSA